MAQGWNLPRVNVSADGTDCIYLFTEKMKKKENSRRKFIKEALGAAGLMIAGSPVVQVIASSDKKQTSPFYDAKGLPTTTLGKTGVIIPRMAVGLGSRFCGIPDEDTAYRLLNEALDNGLYYWDTANSYENKELGVVSEVRLGSVVKNRRKEIFLSTKVASRDPAEARAQIETSLKRLQTDHLDMLKIHDVQSATDVSAITAKGGVADLLVSLKKEGITRFIGFSGHSDASALKAMADTGIFDSLLMAMNHWTGNTEKRQEVVIPAAKARGMGVMIMKTVRPKETIQGLDHVDLIRYALSLKGPDGIIVGMDSLEVLRSNLEILRNFKPLDDARMLELAGQLTPYFNQVNLPWMKAGYRDGHWA
jgi:uncharacterized protein